MITGGDGKPPLDELVHFGVKGMKWGVRRAKTTKQDSTNNDRRKSRQALILLGTAVAINILAKHGSTILTDHGSANTATSLSSTAAKLKFVKPNSSGVHKITTMK